MNQPSEDVCLFLSVSAPGRQILTSVVSLAGFNRAKTICRKVGCSRPSFLKVFLTDGRGRLTYDVSHGSPQQAYAGSRHTTSSSEVHRITLS